MAPRWAIQRQASGFTLIELMVVVAIVAILVLVAYPAYRNAVVKANRGEAQAYLLEAAQRQEQYRTTARVYAPDPNALGATPPASVLSNYALDFGTTSNPPPPTFTLTLTPRAGTVQEGDGALTITETGEKLRGTETW